MDPNNFKSTKLRAQTIEELEGALNDLRSELASLRVNQVSSGVAAKLAKIGVNFRPFTLFPSPISGISLFTGFN